MIVSIVGAHGTIARHLTRILAGEGTTVRGLVRNPDHHDDLRSDGAQPVPCDLETAPDAELDDALRGSDVVVFAAGAGPGSGPDRKQTVDRDGAIACVRAAERLGVGRFVIVSSMGTDDPPTDDETFSVYLRAKAAADDAVRASSLGWTIVRPGALTDDAATGEVRIERHVDRGEVPRADVAAVLAELILSGGGVGATIELVSGTTPIPAAVAALAGPDDSNR